MTDPQTYPIPIRRRTLPETLAYLSRDLIEHPGKYEPLALSILLDQLAGQARDLERVVETVQLCDDTAPELLLTGPMSPCIKRAGHASPEHRNRDGATWVYFAGDEAP